jgi:lambda family phage portal protein
VARILDSRGNPIRIPDRGAPRSLRGRYDAAQSGDDNRRHWANADNLSARAANSPEVRSKLRDRARYEAANNSYASGIATTLAKDLVGTGPRLQLTTADDDFNREVEVAWNDWCRAVNLPATLRTMRRARAVDGESFALLETSESIPGAVKLDVRVIEADQCATPYAWPLAAYEVDGIRFDRRWRPVEYLVLRSHPGDDLQHAAWSEYDVIPARLVIHWFRADRPRQFRGVPEFTPALNLFAQLRRYTLAVLSAAETAAEYAAVLESDMPPDVENVEATPAGETVEIERNMLVTLPSGHKLSQLRAEQPTTTYEMFKRELIREVARCLDVPYNVAAGDSSLSNYSSGRLDFQGYYRSLDVDRTHLEVVGLDPIFAAWLAEAGYVLGAVPRGTPAPPHRWLWPGFPYVDPQKEASAKETQLRNYLTTFSDECQAQGVDPEARVQTIAADVKLFASFGLPSPYVPATTQAPATPPTDTQDTEDGHQSQPEDASGRLFHRNGLARP